MKLFLTIAAVAATLLAGACAAPQGDYFRNPATGDVVKACAPLPGLALAVDEAERFCAQAYGKAGWDELRTSGNPPAALR